MPSLLRKMHVPLVLVLAVLFGYSLPRVNVSASQPPSKKLISQQKTPPSQQKQPPAQGQPGQQGPGQPGQPGQGQPGQQGPGQPGQPGQGQPGQQGPGQPGQPGQGQPGQQYRPPQQSQPTTTQSVMVADNAGGVWILYGTIVYHVDIKGEITKPGYLK